MVIILILWHVRQGREKAFIKAWKEEFYVNNRDKLIVTAHPSWNLSPPHPRLAEPR